MTRQSSLCILICSHNRAQLLLRTLEYLNAAQRPNDWNIWIHVVANACTDDTIEKLEQFKSANQANGLEIYWSEQSIPGKSHTLNKTIPQIEADLIAFVDDDHRVDPTYLNEVCNAANKHPEADLFCGRILPDWDGSEPAWVHDDGPYMIYPLPVPRFDQGDASKRLTPEIAIPGGGNLVIRNGWFQRVGEFSSELGPTGHDLGGSEDLDWVMRALNIGAKLQYMPSVIQYHYVDQDRLKLSYLMEKAYKRTASTIGLNINKTSNNIPLYLYRKTAVYLFNALTTINSDRRRFFLVRTSAALGEIAGLIKQKRIVVD